MEEPTSLAELRKRHDKPLKEWIKQHAPWLLNPDSLFYFGCFIFFVGILWMFYSLFTNSGTQLYGWDYSSQYTQFAYRFHDEWRYFLKTGKFTLYDTATFFGTDNIGSNSYYGLFDPFVFICVLFPRSWVPQMFAFATILKGICGAFAIRAYLKYMGVKEGSARVGATAFAFCGYINFFVGFPSAVSMCCSVPLILLGIEKVIREKKPTILIFGLFLLGLISFFFLVVLCIFGVLYALWRYFWTIKQRDTKSNLEVIGIGIMAFALGLMLCAWTLFPSLRESSLSGRTSSVGAAYLSSLKSAFKNFNVGEIFSLLFQMVGGNSSRELMGLVSFFYPTVNYLWLPLIKSTTSYAYDAWTSSLFCYTPMVIFFIFGMISSIRKRKWQHLAALGVCSYFLFTTFAYYFFYAFTGDGYGRWFIVLVPLIILEGCYGLDDLKEAPYWQLPIASLLSLLGTLGTFFITKFALSSPQDNWLNLSAYYYTDFDVPAVVNGYSLIWVVFYQICLVVVECVAIYFLQHKDCLPKVLMGFIAIETAVSGNCSFFYGSSWSYANSYNGGSTHAAYLQDAIDNINKQDSSFFRVYQDGSTENNASMAFGFNASSNFHSLFNYDVAELGRFSHIVYNESTYGPVYGEMITSKSWSGYYNHKRADFDFAMGYKYYVIQNEGYSNWDNYDYAYNVPFDSKVVYQNDRFRVYENPNALSLGHAVDNIYKITSKEDADTPNMSNMYSGSYGVSGSREILRNENIYLNGAAFESDAEIPAGFTVSSIPDTVQSDYSNITKELSLYKYTTIESYGGYHQDNPGAFLVDSSLWENDPKDYGNITVATYGQDHDKIVLKREDGGYINSDSNGAYFVLSYNNKVRTRIYMIGDKYDSDGNLVAENVLLNYEYFTLRNAISGGNVYYNGAFGFYAPGKVKAIVFCRKVEEKKTLEFNKPTIYMMERSVYDDRLKYINNSEYALSEVNYEVDKFTFKSNFSKKRICVTSLGYDAGWGVKATYKGTSGENITEDCPVYKLDGGLVGFLAPEGEVTYTMTYMTPYLKAGVGLSVAAIIIYFGFQVTSCLMYISKKKKETMLIGKEKEDESSNSHLS